MAQQMTDCLVVMMVVSKAGRTVAMKALEEDVRSAVKWADG